MTRLSDRFLPEPIEDEDLRDLVEWLREQYLDLAQIIANDVPEGRERALALTHLEQSAMWAVQAVQQNQVRLIEEANAGTNH